MKTLICVGCMLGHGPEFPQEPTVQLRQDGKARCNDCAKRAGELAVAPDDYGMHEVLDRAHLLQHVFERFIVEHAVVIKTPELTIAAERLNEQLVAFYQLVGSKHLDD